MAFEVRNDSQEVTGFKLKFFKGIGEFTAIAVNPTAAELAKLYNSDKVGDPIEYLKKNEKGIDVLTIAIFLKNEAFDFITSVKFRIANQMFISEKNGAKKLQVIDSYGATTWVTEDQFNKKEVPVFKNGAASIDKNYRPAFKGEEQINSFIRTLLNLRKTQPGVLTNIDKITSKKGELVNEVKEAIKLAGENKIKCCVGIDVYNNKPFMKVYAKKFMYHWQDDVQYVQGAVLTDKQSGYDTADYDFMPLHEYKVEPTEQKEENKQPFSPFGGTPAPAQTEEPKKEFNPFAQPANDAPEEKDSDLPF